MTPPNARAGDTSAGETRLLLRRGRRFDLAAAKTPQRTRARTSRRMIVARTLKRAVVVRYYIT